jgi:hypothetical protein
MKASLGRVRRIGFCKNKSKQQLFPELPRKLEPWIGKHHLERILLKLLSPAGL